MDSLKTRHCLMSTLVLVSLFCSMVSAGYNKIYRIPSDISSCSPQRSREIDGATIISSPSTLMSNSACFLKFQSDDDTFTSKRLMINFEVLNFSTCDATLSIFFHYSTQRTPDYTFTCNSPKPPIIYTPGKYATFRLDTLSATGFDFKIIVTSYKETSFCREFRCANRKCIEDKLRCDGVNHCGDNSDELHCTGVRTRRGRLGLGSSLASAFSSLIVVIICIVFCVVCFRRRRAAMAQHGEILQQQTLVHTGGPPPGMPPPGMNQPPPGSYPMGPTGYQGVPNYNPGGYPPPPPGQGPNQPPPPYGYAPQGPGYAPQGPGYYPPPGNVYPPGANPAYPPGAMPYPPPGAMPPGQGPVSYNTGADMVKMP